MSAAKYLSFFMAVTNCRKRIHDTSETIVSGHESNSMQERRVTISNRLGLHARAAARLVRRASQFDCNVELLREDTGEKVDGKSILSVLLLAAARGTSLIIKTDGEDEERAVLALVELVDQKFGEELSDGVF